MARCMYPYMVERKLYFSQTDRLVPVPCGKCPECLKRRLASWSFRLEIEALDWPVTHFVTLTYNTDFVPISDNGFMTLQPDHVTKFFKRLRMRSGKLRYYFCGEYGTRNKRPHYHLILFGNASLSTDDIVKCWTDPVRYQSYGDVYFGKVEPASIRYTVQYYDKGDWRKAHSRDDRVPEFSRMSQGLGASFMTDAQVKHFLADPSKAYIFDREGRKIAIPRYYKKRLYDYLSNERTVMNNPSLLLHRDEMLDLKEAHHLAVAEVMKDIVVDEDDSEERNHDRRMAIVNYRASKRKTRT